MDPTYSDFHLLCVPFRRDTVDRMEHSERWIREKGSADFNRKLICFLCPSDLILPLLTAFKALQQTNSAKTHSEVGKTFNEALKHK